MVSEQNNTVVNTLFKYPQDPDSDYTKACEKSYIAPNSLMCTLFPTRESLAMEKDIKRNGTTREIREQEWTHTFTDWKPFIDRYGSSPTKDGTRLPIEIQEDEYNRLRFFGVSYEETRRVNGQAVNVPAKITGTVNINTSVASLRQRKVRRGQYLALDVYKDSGKYYVNVDSTGISGYEDHYQISLRPAKPKDYGNGLLVGRFDGYADASQNSIRVVLQMYGVCPDNSFQKDDLFDIYKAFMSTLVTVTLPSIPDTATILGKISEPAFFAEIKKSLFDDAAMMNLIKSVAATVPAATPMKRVPPPASSLALALALDKLTLFFEEQKKIGFKRASGKDVKGVFEDNLGVDPTRVKGMTALLGPLEDVECTDAMEDAIKAYLDAVNKEPIKDIEIRKEFQRKGAGRVLKIINSDPKYTNSVLTEHLKKVYYALGDATTDLSAAKTPTDMISKLNTMKKVVDPDKEFSELSKAIQREEDSHYKAGQFKKAQGLISSFRPQMKRAITYLETFGVYDAKTKKFEGAETDTIDTLKNWYSDFEKSLDAEDLSDEKTRIRFTDFFNDGLKTLLSGEEHKVVYNSYTIAQFNDKDKKYTLPYQPTLASMNPKDPIVESVVVEAKKERKTKRRKKDPSERPSDPIVVEMDVDGK